MRTQWEEGWQWSDGLWVGCKMCARTLHPYLCQFLRVQESEGTPVFPFIFCIPAVFLGDEIRILCPFFVLSDLSLAVHFRTISKSIPYPNVVLYNAKYTYRDLCPPFRSRCCAWMPLGTVFMSEGAIFSVTSITLSFSHQFRKIDHPTSHTQMYIPFVRRSANLFKFNWSNTLGRGSLLLTSCIDYSRSPHGGHRHLWIIHRIT
jgi:hypothetical protein